MKKLVFIPDFFPKCGAKRNSEIWLAESKMKKCMPYT